MVYRAILTTLCGCRCEVDYEGEGPHEIIERSFVVNETKPPSTECDTDIMYHVRRFRLIRRVGPLDYLYREVWEK